jgi:hypothetical protein
VLSLMLGGSINSAILLSAAIVLTYITLAAHVGDLQRGHPVLRDRGALVVRS